jgi:hypothetical protein
MGAKNFEREYQAAVRRAAKADAVEPRAKSACYDKRSRRIIVDLKNGSRFMFPPELAQGLADAEERALSNIHVSPSGAGISFMIPLSWNSATREDLGLAFVNPQSSNAAVSTAVAGVDGIQVGASVSFTIPAGAHIARLTRQQLFQDATGISDSFVGSIQVTSNFPIAVTALQFQGADYRTVSPVVIGFTGNLPANGNIGGAGALIFLKSYSGRLVFGDCRNQSQLGSGRRSSRSLRQ